MFPRSPFPFPSPLPALLPLPTQRQQRGEPGARRQPPPHFPLAESAGKAVTWGRGSPAPGPPSWRKVWGESGWGRGRRRGSGGGAARRGEGERASGPRQVRRPRRRRRRRKGRWGCGRQGELLPRSLTPFSSAPRAPGGAGGRGAGQGGGAAPTRPGAHPSSERTPLAGTLWWRRRCGGPRRCACGA